MIDINSKFIEGSKRKLLCTDFYYGFLLRTTITIWFRPLYNFLFLYNLLNNDHLFLLHTAVCQYITFILISNCYVSSCDSTYIVTSNMCVCSRIPASYGLKKNCSLSFLDLLLKVVDDKIIIDWYHKSSFSGKCLSYFFSHLSCHKIGTIYSLLDRAILLSHSTFQQKNIEICVKIHLENGYPLDLIFREMNTKFKKLFKNIRITNHCNSLTLGESNNNDNKKHLVIPYIHEISELIASIIDKPEYVVGYKGLNKLSELIKVQKGKSASTSNNNVVYRVNCNNCNDTW